MPCDELTICRCHYVKNAVGPGLAAVLRNRWICGSRWIGANRAFCGSVGPCRWIGVPQTACIGHYPNLVIAAGPSRGSTLEQTATPRLWPQASQIRAVRFVPQNPLLGGLRCIPMTRYRRPSWRISHDCSSSRENEKKGHVCTR